MKVKDSSLPQALGVPPQGERRSDHVVFIKRVCGLGHGCMAQWLLLSERLMLNFHDVLIAACLFVGAIVYTSVGHGGASAYIAIMSLFGVAVPVIKPTALVLNIIVSSYTSYRFITNKLFDVRLFVPLVAGAIPAAFIGGYIHLPSDLYKPLVGVILLYSGVRFVLYRAQQEREPRKPNWALAVAIGASIGLLAGLTGTGGGIFLSPLLLLLGWTTVKGASGTAAAFIFVNSVSGLLGNISSVSRLPDSLPLFAIAVLMGALIGTRFGIKHLSHVGVKRMLGVVLLIAGGKLTFGL